MEIPYYSGPTSFSFICDSQANFNKFVSNVFLRSIFKEYFRIHYVSLAKSRLMLFLINSCSLQSNIQQTSKHNLVLLFYRCLVLAGTVEGCCLPEDTRWERNTSKMHHVMCLVLFEMRQPGL